MIDFSQVASIQRYKYFTLPTPNKLPKMFRYLDYQGDGMEQPMCLWKRPLYYPAMGFFISFTEPDGIFMQNISWALIDSCSIVRTVEADIKRKIVEAGIAHSNPLWSSQPEHNLGTTLWHFVLVDGNAEDYYDTGYDSSGATLFKDTFNNGVKLTTYIIDSASLNSIDTTPGAVKLHRYVQYSQGLTWHFSDVTTKKILLYARPDLQNPVLNSTWGPGTSVHDTIHNDWSLELTPHSTDVVVDAGEPLVTLLPVSGSEEVAAKGAIRRIKIRTNLDDYKAKYDVATNGSFPKSQYPYLRAVISIEPHSYTFSIQRKDFPHWDMMYLVFETKR